MKKVIITIDDVSHILVPDSPGSTCQECSLRNPCWDQNNCLCYLYSGHSNHHFELLTPENKTKGNDKG